MKQMLQICCKNNNISKEFPIGSSLLDIYYGFNLNFPYQVVSAKVNNRSEGLNFRVYNNKDVEFLDVRDSSGMRTYVRSLCRDIGRALGCCAYMPFLLRTASGTFDISEAHTIAELKELKEAGELQSVVVPVDEAARHLPELRLFNLSEKQRTLISNGASVECGQAEPGTVYRLYLENEFMGLALRDDSGLHITVWFGKEK